MRREPTRSRRWPRRSRRAAPSGRRPPTSTTTFSCVLRFPLNTPGGSSPDLGHEPWATPAGRPRPARGTRGAGWVTKGSRTTARAAIRTWATCATRSRCRRPRRSSTSSRPRSGFRPDRREQSSRSRATAPASRPGTRSTSPSSSTARARCRPRTSPNVKDAALELLEGVRREPAATSRCSRFPIRRPSTSARLRARRTTPTLHWGTQRNGSPSLSRTTTRTRPGTSTPRAALVTRINCLERAASPTIVVAGNRSPSQSHTDLGDPMAAAAASPSGHRAPDGARRDRVHDGRRGQPAVGPDARLRPIRCSYANDRASTAKQTGVLGQGVAEVYTDRLPPRRHHAAADQVGTYRAGGPRDNATELLADMADQLDRQLHRVGLCPIENTDSASLLLRRFREQPRRGLQAGRDRLGQVLAADRRRLSSRRRSQSVPAAIRATRA